jgi:hypothetical protein
MVPRTKDQKCRRACTITTRAKAGGSPHATAEPAGCADSEKTADAGGRPILYACPASRSRATTGIERLSSAQYQTRSPRTDRGQTMKRPKVFAVSFQYHRPIPRPASFSHNRCMERPTINELETAREIEDLSSRNMNLRLQLEFANQQLRTLRVRLNRYESALGIEEAA